jgi:hypothetical protein
MNNLTICPELAAARVTQEPVKVYLTKDRVGTFKFNIGSSMEIEFLVKTSASVSDLSTNGSSGLTSPRESDDEQDLVLSKEARTTVVMKNLSQSCTVGHIVDLLDLHGFHGKYDLVYVPMDFTSMLSHCYAFVNFSSEGAALEFLSRGTDTQGFSESSYVGEGGSKIDWAAGMQGLPAAIEKYRNSPIMHALVPDECKPLLFDDGRITTFPKPTKKIQKPRIGGSRQKLV